MYFYCTYFDHRYLPKGLALYRSLQRHVRDFKLWVLCLDRPCYDVLVAMGLPQIAPILLEDFERGDEALAQAKLDRTLVEYYFTCTPSLPLYIFRHHPEVDLVTYLDSDIFFFSDPTPVYAELEGRSIGIIEHRFPPKLAPLAFNGIYNVGWVSFRRDSDGLACLNWWRDRCNEWCHDYHQDGKFADQKYLDDWPQRFGGVAVLQYPGINVAPWNLDTYRIAMQGDRLFVGDRPAIFFHFHGLKALDDGNFDINVSFYHVEQLNDAVMFAYRTYIAALQQTQAQVTPYLPEASLTKTARFKPIPATDETTLKVRSGESRGKAEAVEVSVPQDSPFSCARPLEPSDLGNIPARVSKGLARLGADDRGALAELRDSLAIYLLEQPFDRLEADWNRRLGAAHRAVWQCGLKNEPPTDHERATIERLATQATDTPSDAASLAALLAAMLYVYPHHLTIDPTRLAMPGWLVAVYMEFMFESPRLFKAIGEVDRYHEYFARWTQFVRDRVRANPDGPAERYFIQTYANAANLTPTYFSTREPVTIQMQRAELSELFLRQQNTTLDYEFGPRPATRRKIRFGILSLNFDASAETFTVLPIFENLDREKFEIHLFAFQSHNSETERYCRQHADRFTHLLHRHADRLVRMIRAADLDILLVGSNITARSYPITMVSAHRLARVQASGISSSVTTGFRNMDYYIGAELTTPAATAQRYYTEKLVTLPGSGLCFSFPPVSDEATVDFSREKLGLAESTTIFISGANFRKINPELRDTWAKLLARVPDSILVIYPFGPNWGLHPNLEMPFFNQMQRALQRHGVDLKRLLLVKTMPSVADVRACLVQADVYLDSFPYSGAASAIDPLASGLPFVSLEGNEQRERQSSSLLRELGMAELVTGSEAAYLDLAAKLAGDRAQRDRVRQTLRDRMADNPSFLDKVGYARKIEALLESLVDRWRPGASPTPTPIAEALDNRAAEPVQML
ncbi:MAG: hypothetical protein ACFB9N_13370 [Geitlerinemataceae cyanobacterium]